MKRRYPALATAALGLAGLALWMNRSTTAVVATPIAPVVAAAPVATPLVSEKPRLVIGPPEYQTLAESDPHPGEGAVRAFTDDFMAVQADEVKAHLAREKITLDETRELTYFAIVARTSLDWDAVETVTGHPIHPNARKYATDAMFDASEQMKNDLHAEVAANDPEAKRWETIRGIEAKYLARYYDLTGMSPELLDWLEWEQIHNQHADANADLAANTAPPPAAAGTHAVDRHLGQARL